MDPDEINGQAPTEPPSLRDTIANAFAEDAAADPAPAPAAPAPQAAAPAQQPAAPVRPGEPARGPDGKFVAKPAEQGQAQPKPEPNAPAGKTEPQPETIRPPASWSATAKADFATLPPHIQQEVLKREKDIEDGKAQWDQKGERLNRLDTVLGPRRERFALAGVDEVQAVQALFAAQDYLEKSPYEGIAYLARQYGVDLGRFGAGGPAQAAPQQQLMPPVIQQFAQRLQGLETSIRQQQSQAHQAVQSSVHQSVSEFLADPAFPYASNLVEDMAALLQSNRAQDLKGAYDLAVWANPETRALMLKAEADKTAQANSQQAQAARRAGVSVIGSPTPGSSPANSGPAPTLRDELLRNFAEASS